MNVSWPGWISSVVLCGLSLSLALAQTGDGVME